MFFYDLDGIFLCHFSNKNFWTNFVWIYGKHWIKNTSFSLASVNTITSIRLQTWPKYSYANISFRSPFHKILMEYCSATFEIKTLRQIYLESIGKIWSKALLVVWLASIQALAFDSKLGENTTTRRPQSYFYTVVNLWFAWYIALPPFGKCLRSLVDKFRLNL